MQPACKEYKPPFRPSHFLTASPLPGRSRPWPIARFIERDAEFLYVPADQLLDVAKQSGAIPNDIPGVAPWKALPQTAHRQTLDSHGTDS
jgi:hypothetical protein